MNPGPQLHRSLTFWAGLILILFTSWAWRDSSQNYSVLRWKQFNVASITRGFMIARYTAAEWPEPDTERIPAAAYYTNLQQETLPAAFLVRHGKPNFFTGAVGNPTLKQTQQATANSGTGSWSLFLPYWLILITIILTWTAFLFFRARRRRHAIAPPLKEHAT